MKYSASLRAKRNLYNTILSRIVIVVLIVSAILLTYTWLNKQGHSLKRQGIHFTLIKKVEIDFRNFKREVCIGHGGFATVNLCSIPPDYDRKFVVKHFDSMLNIKVKHFTSFIL